MRDSGFRVVDDASIEAPICNFEMYMGDQESITFLFYVRKTWVNRVRYWLFFKFFPFKLKRWVDA